MGIDWEEILDAEGEDIADAYEDAVYDADIAISYGCDTMDYDEDDARDDEADADVWYDDEADADVWYDEEAETGARYDEEAETDARYDEEAEADARDEEAPAERRNVMVEYFNEVMRNCAALVGEHFHNGEPDDVIGPILGVHYQNPVGEDFHYDDPLYNAVYFLRYGYAYAYEYSVIYKLIMDDYDPDNNIFGVSSFGCGSCIDAWALGYANGQTARELSLRYAGTDQAEWGILLKPENGNAMESAFTYDNDRVGMRYPGCPGMENMQGNILDFFHNQNWVYSYNTIMFSKILNELADQARTELVACIREQADRFQADRAHYICISHSKYDYFHNPAMRTIAREICEAINYDGRFEVDYTLPGNWVGNHGLGLEDVSEEGDVPCYQFPVHENGEDGWYDHISFLNDDFTPIEEVEEIRSILNPALERENRHQCVTRTSASLFQIVKLSPREG